MPSNSHTPVTMSVVILALVLGILDASRQFLPVLLDVHLAAVSVLLLTLSILGFLLVPVVLFGLAYWAGTRADVPREYGSIALRFGLLGGLGYLVGYTVTAVVAGGDSSLLHFAPTMGFRAITRGATFAVTSVAGAAVAHFRKQNA